MPPYLAPQDGSFEFAPAADGSGAYVVGQATPQRPIFWHPRDQAATRFPYAVIGSSDMAADYKSAPACSTGSGQSGGLHRAVQPPGSPDFQPAATFSSRVGHAAWLNKNSMSLRHTVLASGSGRGAVAGAVDGAASRSRRQRSPPGWSASRWLRSADNDRTRHRHPRDRDRRLPRHLVVDSVKGPGDHRTQAARRAPLARWADHGTVSDHQERWRFPLTQVELRQLWTYSDGDLTTKGIRSRAVTPGPGAGPWSTGPAVTSRAWCGRGNLAGSSRWTCSTTCPACPITWVRLPQADGAALVDLVLDRNPFMLG